MKELEFVPGEKAGLKTAHVKYRGVFLTFFGEVEKIEISDVGSFGTFAVTGPDDKPIAVVTADFNPDEVL